MTEQEQQIALSEWMGWKIEYDDTSPRTLWVKSPTPGLNYAAYDLQQACSRLPNTNSLDVLHEMELKLVDTHGGSSRASDHEPVRHAHELSKVVGIELRKETVVSDLKQPDGSPLLLNTYVPASPFELVKLVRATAAQRREALLRTLGLWKEEAV